MKYPIIQYSIIAIYFAFILIKGIRHAKNIHNDDDFLVAGRNVGWLFLLCTMSATVIGGGSSIGALGKTYEWGILMLVVSSGLYVHFIFSGWFVAPYFRKAKLYTVAGFFGHRFNAKCRFSAFVLSLLFSIGVLVAQMVAFGKIVTSIIPQLPYIGAIIISGGIVILYSTAGGLLAVIHTDVYQFIILILGFLITLAFCIPELLTQRANIQTVIQNEFFQLEGGKGWVFLFSTFIAFLLGETFAPGYATRYCIGKNIKETKKGIIGSGIFLFFTFPVILFFLALYASLSFPDIDPEQALPQTILKLNNPYIGCLIIAALLSAIMSSADSILNSSTAIFVKDFYEEYIVKAKNNFKNSLKISRISSFTLGASGILLALILPNIIDLLLLTYSLWAPSIILPVIVGIFTKRTSKSFNNLIFIVMIFSAIATIIFMNTDYKYAMQPSVFGVVFSIIVFFIGKIVIGKKLIIE